MNRQQSALTSLCLISLLTASNCLPAVAFKSPGGAIAGANKVMKGMAGGENNLAFSPLLLELAKLIGRTGLAPGFFLQNEGTFSDEPSIDLRTLLLFQAGLIKAPVHLTGAKKPPVVKPDPLPVLRTLSIPESEKPMESETPSDLPSLATTPLPRDPERSQVISPKVNVGTPEKISLIASGRAPTDRPASSPLLSIDVNKLQTDLGNFGKEQPEVTELIAEIPHLAMSMPRTSSMPFITRNMFRLWTWRTDNTEAKSTDGEATIPATTYNGTFVVASTGVIKEITGRHFTLSSGRVLANNQGGDLLFQTELGAVSLEPQATAVIEVASQNGNTTVKVYALESESDRAVTVKLPDSKEPVILGAGEVMVMANNQLSSSDLAGLELKNHPTPKTAVGTFAINQFIEKELTLRSAEANQQSEQYAALSSLKHRLQGPVSH